MSSTEHANDERHYMLLTVAIIIIVAGIYLRFVGEAPYLTWSANIILVVGVCIALRGVFSILK